MTSEQVLAKVRENIADFFSVDLNSLAASTTAEEVPGWDSFAHVNLVLQLESDFDVRFSSTEIAAAKNIGELAEKIRSKIATH